MLLRRFVFYCLTLVTPLAALPQLQPIGQWRDHLPYHHVTAVAYNADKIWAATPYSLFAVDMADNSMQRWSTINGLTETGISTMGADESTGKLIIGYTSSNIDVLSGNDIININALKNSSATVSKTIYSVFVYNQLAYLCTGFGIVVIDLNKYEVKDTYVIGAGGGNTKVNALATDGNFFYAATEEGLKQAPVNIANLSDFRNWQLLSGANGLAVGPLQSVVTASGNIIVLKDDSLFVKSGSGWNLLYTDGWLIKNITVSDDKILLSEELNNAGRIIAVTTSGTVTATIQDPDRTKKPGQAIFFQNNYWIADSLAGLSKYDGSAFESYIPNSPYSIATGAMQVVNNVLWATAGAVTSTWQPVNNKNGIYRFAEGAWNNFNNTAYTRLDSFPDCISIAVDPADQSAWAGSYGGGLLQISTGNTLTIFKQNSPIQPAYFDLSSYRVSGLTFDAERNLWITNYGGAQNLHVKKSDDSWQSFSVPFPLAESAVSQIIVDDINQKWIVAPNGNGLICFNHGQTIENPGDDQWKWYRTGQGNGNLPDNNVLCIAKDKNNIVWVGTIRGIGIIQCPEQVFTTQGCEAVLPIVQQDNFAGYLFRDEQVQAIAVDGADRKWIGTRNGVWLISADAEKTIYRFTESNSPLPGNDVKQIAIDGQTGEVYFATTKGICSFRSTATEGTTANSNVLVFPNPVPPGYSGAIAIRGVANNAIVKITEMDGRLVYQTRALGGQATWNGKDYRGRTISTGIYLVLVSDDTRQEKTVAKIVFVHR